MVVDVLVDSVVVLVLVVGVVLVVDVDSEVVLLILNFIYHIHQSWL